MAAEPIVRIRQHEAPDSSARATDARSRAPGNRPRNEGVPLHVDWVDAGSVNLSAVEHRAATLTTPRTVKKEWKTNWPVQAITCRELTPHSGDDTPACVARLCTTRP